MASIRTFIAFDTPDPIKKEMSRVQSELKKSRADVKWENDQKFHATIKFLGDVDEFVLTAITSTCEDVVQRSPMFDATYQSIGCFPNKKQPRVIWIGCENSDGGLLQIKNSIDQALLRFGFAIENRAFHPHITLGRIRSSEGFQNLIPMLENLTFEPKKAFIKELIIMKSVLKPGGSEYTILKTIHLQQ